MNVNLWHPTEKTGRTVIWRHQSAVSKHLPYIFLVQKWKSIANIEEFAWCLFFPPPHPTPPLPLCLSLFIVFSQRQKHGNPQLESDVENCWPHLWTSCILVLVLAIRHVITCFSGTSYIYLYLIYLYTSYGTILTNLGKFGIN